jgi:hypothetical protein
MQRHLPPALPSPPLLKKHLYAALKKPALLKTLNKLPFKAE